MVNDSTGLSLGRGIREESRDKHAIGFFSAGRLFVRLLIAQQDREHLNCMGRMNRSKDNTVPAGDFPIVAFVGLSFERFHEAAEGVFFEYQKVIGDAFAAIGIALSCFAASA
jgi:hypothetical protein